MDKSHWQLVIINLPLLTANAMASSLESNDTDKLERGSALEDEHREFNLYSAKTGCVTVYGNTNIDYCQHTNTRCTLYLCILGCGIPYAWVACMKLDSNHFTVAILPGSKCLSVILNYITKPLFQATRKRPQEFITFGLDIITRSDTAVCLKESYILLNASCTHAMNPRQGLRKTTLGLYHTSGWHHRKRWGGDLSMRLDCSMAL